MEGTNKDYGTVTWNIEDVLSEADALNLSSYGMGNIPI